MSAFKSRSAPPARKLWNTKPAATIPSATADSASNSGGDGNKRALEPPTERVRHQTRSSGQSHASRSSALASSPVFVCLGASTT